MKTWNEIGIGKIGMKTKFDCILSAALSQHHLLGFEHTDSTDKYMNPILR